MTAKVAKRISDRAYKRIPKEVINLILRMVSIYARDGETSYTFNGKIRDIKFDAPQSATISRTLRFIKPFLSAIFCIIRVETLL